MDKSIIIFVCAMVSFCMVIIAGNLKSSGTTSFVYRLAMVLTIVFVVLLLIIFIDWIFDGSILFWIKGIHYEK